MQKNIEILRYPVEKDMTDSELALETAVGRGCKKIYILGAVGSRLDHSIANIFLLAKLLLKGVTGIIADERNEIFLVNDCITISQGEHAASKVSLIPFTGKVKGVSTAGLKYPLDNAELEIGSSLGISNEFSGTEAKITVQDGLLLVIVSRD